MLDKLIDELFNGEAPSISSIKPQMMNQFLLNQTKKGAITANYKHLIACKYRTREHPNMKKWQEPMMKRRIAMSTPLIRKAAANLKIANTTAHAHKVSQECYLGSMRTEKHTVHFPDHPTGYIRSCPVCEGTDSMIHAMIDCVIPTYI